MRSWALVLTLACVMFVACGGRIASSSPEAAKAPVDSGSQPPSSDAQGPDAATARDAQSTACPPTHPVLATGCDEKDEGLSCGFGTKCRSECICERGSWVCSSDTCEATCPAAPPADAACNPDETGRTCTYHGGCPVTCTCTSEASGARWACTSPPC
ncbi:MAG: hypothetical protein HOO96_39825 [Polyangiaceae bacterium]|nr:hypothetical protein [Polyangiaceae bacterium]